VDEYCLSGTSPGSKIWGRLPLISCSGPPKDTDVLEKLTGRAWPVWIVLGVGACLLYTVIPSAGAGSLFSAATGVASVGCSLYAVRRYRSASVAAWLIFIGGQLSWVLGDLAYAGDEFFLHYQPYPSWADVLYLCAYPLLVTGLFLLTRAHGPRNRAELIDSAVIATGLGLVYWIIVIEPVATDAGTPGLVRLTTVAYPTGGVLLCAVLLPLLARSGRRTPSAWLLMLGSLATFVGNAVYTLLPSPSAYMIKLVFGAFLFSYLCFAGAAMHPSGHAPVAIRQLKTFTRGQLGLLTGATLLVPATLILEGVRQPGSVSWLAIAIGSIVLFLLVLARLSGSVTRVRVQAEQLEALAMSDDLTGLANRRRFEERLQECLPGGRPQVAILDLNGFKAVNDRFGHAIGDDLLTAVAIRLSQALREGDLVARMGGDEFAVLVPDATRGVMDGVVERLSASLRLPIVAGANDLLVTASIGIADSEETDDPYEIMRRADVAMYVAKSLGENRRRRYEPGMDDQAREQNRLGAELRIALDTGQFHLVYQPIVELPSGRITSVEALIRWTHPERGFISPVDFIPAAERNGLIVEIGEWVLRTACAQAVMWRRTLGALAPQRMSVNVSARQLAEPDFPELVTTVLAWTGLGADNLIVEVTETAVFDGGQAVLAVKTLHELGVHIALDDFGTGHSSLTLLQTVPVDVLKVDKSFVDNITMSGRHAVIATALIQVSDGLGLTAVAEGVETAEQAAELHRLGYRRAQGYYFGRPVAEPDFRTKSELAI
jgi:diguanylate cyclase